MMVNGKMINLMALENISTLMELYTRATGMKTSSMVVVKKHGLIKHVSRVTMLQVKKKEKENLPGVMVQHTRGSLWTIIFTEKVFTIGQMITDVMMEIGKITKCMERDTSHGLTAEFMKESI
jgi:hypothetical protein